MTFLSILNNLKQEEEVKSEHISPFSYRLEKIISLDEIESRIQSLAKVLEKEFDRNEVCIIAVLKGSLWFVTDLIKMLKIPNTLQTIVCSSYGLNGTNQSELRIDGLDSLSIEGKHVIIVDDICDTGATLVALMEKLSLLNPLSLTTAVLLSKNKRGPDGYEPDYALFEIDNVFVVGYGLDYKEYYRGLQGIYILDHQD